MGRLTNIVELVDENGIILMSRLPTIFSDLFSTTGIDSLSSMENQIVSLQDTLSGINTTTITTLQSDVSSLTTGLSTETTDRTSGDAALQASLTTETTARTSGDAALQASLTTETNNRVSGDAALQTDINSLQATVSNINTEIANLVTLDGPLNTYIGTPTQYIITNYDIRRTYSVSVSSGTVSINGNTITVVPTNTIGTITLNVDLNSYTINVLAISVTAPFILGPVSGTTNLPSDIYFFSSLFSTTSLTDTQVSSDWEIATDSAFTNIVKSSIGDTVNLHSWTVTGLAAGTTYYARVQYTGATYGASGWSSAISFSTKQVLYPTSIVSVNEHARLKAYSYYGISTEISNDGFTAICGAKGVSINNNKNQGAVYVSVKKGNTWNVAAELVASDGGAGDNFGSSVSINDNGTVAIIGSPYANIGTSKKQGAAYIFNLVNGVWTQTAKIVASDGLPNDYLGYSVSINSAGTSVSIGAYNRSVSGIIAAGVVYVYNYNGTAWILAGELSSSTNTAGCNFGYSQRLSADGNTLVVGSPYKNIGSNSSQGCAYVYTYNGSVWSLITELNSTNGAAGDNYGYSVDVNSSGGIVLVGAPNKTVGSNTSQGTAYINTLTSGVWSQTVELTSANGASGDTFGHSVSISQDAANIAVGAPYKTIGTYRKQGAVYIFNYSTSWTEVSELTLSGNFSNNYIGSSVCIDSSLSSVSIGAPGYSSSAGIAFIGN